MPKILKPLHKRLAELITSAANALADSFTSEMNLETDQSMTQLRALVSATVADLKPEHRAEVNSVLSNVRGLLFGARVPRQELEFIGEAINATTETDGAAETEHESVTA